MLKRRNAQGLSINLIIFAAVGLVVLVVLIGIFTGKMGGISKDLSGLSTCDSNCRGVGANKGQPAPFEAVCASLLVVGSSQWYEVMPGSYGDVSEGGICCCIYGPSGAVGGESCSDIGGTCRWACDPVTEWVVDGAACPFGNPCCIIIE